MPERVHCRMSHHGAVSATPVFLMHCERFDEPGPPAARGPHRGDSNGMTVPLTSPGETF